MRQPLKANSIAQIRTQSDLKSLCEVSKHVAKAAIPRLYESITLHADEMLDLDDLTQKITFCCNDNIRFAKNIRLKAPLNHNLRRRCPHSDMPEALDDAIDMDGGSEVCLNHSFSLR